MILFNSEEKKWMQNKQECIPVGYVLSAAVAATGGVSAQRGCLPDTPPLDNV